MRDFARQPLASQNFIHKPMPCNAFNPNQRYSQTFENRSSLAANPPAGFEAVVVVPAPGVTGAALLHPPKSSSADTFGGAEMPDENPPPPLGTMFWFAGTLGAEPHPKSLELDCMGGAAIPGDVTLGADAVEPHASLDPHASLLFQPLMFETCG